MITEVELRSGIRNRLEELRIEELLSRFNILPITSAVARIAGDLLRGKSQNERRAHFGDALIAASAIDQGEVVLTADSASVRVFGSQARYQVYR